MRSTRSSSALLLLVTTLVGCPRKAVPQGPPPSLLIYPPSVAHGDSVPCSGRFCASGAGAGGTTLVLNPEGLKVTLRTAPGNVVELAGQRVTVKTEGEDATFDMLAKVTELDARKDVLDVPVKVTSPGGQVVSDTVQLSLGDLFRERLAAIASGPIAFAGDTRTESAGKLIYFAVPSGIPTSRVFGEGRIRDIDLVAVEVRSNERGKPCEEPKSTGNLRLGLGQGSVHDRTFAFVPETTVSTIKVYDRRKGKVVAESTIRGKMPDCPDAASGSLTSGGQTNTAEIDAWLKSLLR